MGLGYGVWRDQGFGMSGLSAFRAFWALKLAALHPQNLPRQAARAASPSP